MTAATEDWETTTAMESKGKTKKVKAVKINKWDEKLNEDTIGKVKGALLSIKNAYVGMVRQTSDAFTEIKTTIPDGNWMVFCRDNETGIADRTIRDLVACNGWLKVTSATDAQIAAHSVRTLAIIAGIDNTSDREKLQRKIEAGERVSQAEAFQVANKGKKQLEKPKTKKELVGEILKLQDDLETVNKGRKAANQEVEQMRDEIALLNGRVVEQQRIIAALTKLGATE
ncbi:hypothetical protein PMIT1313_00393 [Prochlorococcus marinus str. MIT 1313]|uniref:hypothetical protein n=1 Tax=Prochlorococcus TaxID=1218 RepID=UPI0007B3BD99|nr:hypothetical protein [Prochlorococcus marinus]KZR70573.1 hypothetical protein PMIT1313_00393 [Prochlorococcus marinus str. MIT 1313]KZR76293.1 hypothetical protein PMIT1318_00151 [Prochlorococcus marinus str. MIT 1318]